MVEGVGDHGCEYMTNGTIVVLGRTGRNFGAGMTGGVAYVLDLEDRFEALFNPQLIGVERLGEEDVVLVQQLVYKHLENTESERAKEILADWPKFGAKFWKVRPHPPAAKPQPKASSEAVISEKVTATQP